jgi:hypothetical protein
VKPKTKVALAVLAPALLALALALYACGGEATTTTEAVTTTAASVTTTQDVTTTTQAATTIAQVTTTTTLPPTPTTSVGVSPDSIAYAQSLGGISHEGETLYLVVGATLDSEEQAQAMLDNATPLFGDMQSYFIVQKSDNFEGLEPRWWVVLEAYRSEPSPENLNFDRRGFPMAYVQRATVRTSDPIPVYEDVVGG